jgi:V8-like Glu-specific endopeptidase
MTKTNLIKTLQVIANSDDNTIEKFVAQKALLYYDTTEFFKDIITLGCASVVVDELFFTEDTHKFYDTHYEEIEELRTEYEDSTGDSVDISGRDLKNTLAWFAFEQTAYNLANKLELEV